MSDERYQELYPMSDEDCASVNKNPADDIVNSLADCLTVHRIPDNKLKAFEHLLNDKEIHTLKAAELVEKKNLAEDYEAIVKKQLQLLQADERGRVALEKEIEDIKSRQQKRSVALKARKKALLIEKARAKKMASRPTPLPKSVIMLLKEQERKEVEASNQNTLLQPQNFVEEENDDFENEENVFNQEEMEERKKIQEVWDKKAKIRFNEAIKKERQNKENAEILKEIQNAEQVNRRHLAKTISAKRGNVPCEPPDNIFHSSKQVAMENKVERIFKQNPKEHAVEDLEGYEDRFEAKYREIDSNLEARLIDCVPSFVKENYNYLLEDESTLHCGRRFTGFQNEEDPLNMGFIASPPATEELERSKEVEDIINNLIKMHRETDEMIEKEFKPLLTAKSVPKVESMDKAVEADILKRPTEHKSIEVGTSDADQAYFEPENLDLMSRGVMNFKRKPLSEFPGSARRRFLSPPRVEQDPGKTSGQESWSSSSYWSLPSKHGMPKTCNLCDSPTCRIPLVEHESSPRTCIPLSKSQVQSDRSVSPENNLSHYVRIVAEKYLKSPKDTQIKSLHTEKNGSESEMEHEVFDPTDNRNSFQLDYAEVGFREMLHEENPITDFDGRITSKISHPESSSHPAEAPLPIDMDASAEDSFLRKCDEVISDNLVGLFPQGVPPAKGGYSSDKVQTYSSPFHPGQIVYHELSTIQEMDSALTNDSKRSLERHSVSVGRRSSSRSEGRSDLSIDTTPVSLIEDPPEEVSKLAMSIKFTEKTSPLKPTTARQKEMVVHDSPNPTSPGKAQASNGSEVSAVSSLASKFGTLLSIQTGSLSSCGPLTPSTGSAQPSPASVGSQGAPYAVSSPFKGQPTTLQSLTKYFQDLSSIRKGSSSSASSVTGASEEKNQAQYSVKLEDKLQSQASYGLGSFAPMSLLSGISSPGETGFHTLPQDKSSVPNRACIVSSKGTTKSQSTDFQAMTPLSHDSSWRDLSAEEETPVPESQSVGNNEQKVSYIPMHFEQGFGTDEAASPHSQNSSRFHFLTPHTYLPSLTGSSVSSKTATPSQREFDPREADKSPLPELTSPFDFYPQRKKQTSSLKSQIINSVRSPSKSGSSSPKSKLSLSEVKSFLKQSISSDIVLPTSRGMCKPVNIKLNFQTHSFHSNKENSAVNVSPHPNIAKEKGLEATKEDDVRQYDARSPFSPNRIDNDCKITAKDVGSEPFIPTLTTKDVVSEPFIPTLTAKDVGSEPFLPTLTAKDFCVPSESTEEGQIETPALKPFTPSQVILRHNYQETACANEESPLSRNKIEFSETTPVFPHLPTTPLLQVLKNNDLTGSPGQLSLQHDTPYRSTFQTPSKTLEEMMMETGILNEPDLTLVNSELTIHPCSPEKPWGPVNDQSFPEPSTPFERSFSSMTPARTGVLEDACDSPSMLSFLQHEQSCLLAAEPSGERKEMTQNQLQEKIKESPRSAKKRTPWNEYKSRTKRLWNNLEEVKEKKLQREKREEMLKNRMKMKAYSKILPTTKK